MTELLSIVLCSVAGYAIVSRIVSLHWSLAVAAGYLVGSGWASVVLLALSGAGVRWSIVPVLLTLLAPVVCFALPAAPHGTRRQPISESGRLHLLTDIALIAIVAGYAMYSVAATSTKWDFWAIWGLKARVFFEHGGIDWPFLREPDNIFANPDYPLLVPLVFDLPAILRGTWSDEWLGLVSLAFAGSVIVIVRGLAVEETGSRSLGSVLALGASGFALSVYVGLAEVPLIAYASAGLLLLRLGVVRNDRRLIRLAALLIGCGALTKNEGMAAAASIGIALWVATRSARKLVDYAPAVVAVAGWVAIRLAASLPSYYLAGGTLFKQLESHLSQLSTIAAAMRETPPEKPLFWAVAVIVAAFGFRVLVRQERLVAVATLLQFAAFLAAYAVTSHPVEWQIRTSWPRLLNQIAIPVLYVAFVQLVSLRDAQRTPEAIDGTSQVPS